MQSNISLLTGSGRIDGIRGGRAVEQAWHESQLGATKPQLLSAIW
jgi:hypothetical protein